MDSRLKCQRLDGEAVFGHAQRDKQQWKDLTEGQHLNMCSKYSIFHMFEHKSPSLRKRGCRVV